MTGAPKGRITSPSGRFSRIPSKHYGLTDEGLDFINYDIKYGMGADDTEKEAE